MGSLWPAAMREENARVNRFLDDDTGKLLRDGDIITGFRSGCARCGALLEAEVVARVRRHTVNRQLQVQVGASRQTRGAHVANAGTSFHIFAHVGVGLALVHVDGGHAVAVVHDNRVTAGAVPTHVGDGAGTHRVNGGT